MDIFGKVKTIIIDNLSCEDSQITMNANLADDLGADSLVAVEIIMALEDEFNITIPEDASKEIKTVADLVKLVESLV